MGSINQDGYVGVSMQLTNNDRWYAHSHDNGDTWDFTFIADGQGARYAGAGDIVPWTVNDDLIVYIPATVDNGANDRPFMYKSTNHGHTFIKRGQLESQGHATRATTAPYQGNENGNIVYAGGTPIGSIMKSTDGGVSFTAVDNGDPTMKRYGIEAFTQNSQRMYAWVNGETALKVSDDGFDTFTTVTTTGILGTYAKASGGFPYNDSLFYLVSNSGIHASLDRGSTWINKNGNWPEKANAVKARELGEGFNVGNTELAYGDTIVPVWISE